MRTRRGAYPAAASPRPLLPSGTVASSMKRRRLPAENELVSLRVSKKTRAVSTRGNLSNGFDAFPDHLLLTIFMSLSSSAASPADLINTMLTCRRFHKVARHSLVLANASEAALKVTASGWSEGAHSFLKQCADAGNVDACYTLGMIRFYCLLDRSGGLSLMAKAAIASHSCALHSLAVIQFNGSGGGRKDKDLKAGVGLCAKAASLGHIDAMRELGHCLQDGYGVSKNVLEGRRLILEANAREAAAAVTANSKLTGKVLQLTASKIVLGCFRHRFLYEPASRKISRTERAALQHAAFHISDFLDRHPVYKFLQSGGCSLLSDFGCNVPPPKLHIAHQFLVDWFAIHQPSGGLRLCSHANCGRPETRKHEFRLCSACGSVNYCSRACQALDWKLQHKYDCVPVAEWEQDGGDDQFADHNMDDS